MHFLRFLRGTQKLVTKKRWSSIWARGLLPDDCNILLMGSPGCGKTSVGRVLAAKLNRPVIDVDNDHLESVWGMTVGEKLSVVGDEHFLQEEGEALLKLNPSPGSIVSLTGSNPLHAEAMRHIRKTGISIFIDVDSRDILTRLRKMKVDRVVTHTEGESVSDTLRYRRNFYEKAYDIRVLCERFEPIESVASKIEEEINKIWSPPVYTSTRYTGSRSSKTEVESDKCRFTEAVLKGLAWDGGLFVLDGSFPQMTIQEWDRMTSMSFQERGLCILEKWLHPEDIHPERLRELINQAYSTFSHPEIVPVVRLDGNQFLVELFHGPTASFKDAALQLMPQLLAHAASKDGTSTRYLIVVATSGDTGSAALSGFSRLESDNIKVLVLYPEHGISSVQKALMRSVDSQNVRVIGVNGDFDSCQSVIKSMFNTGDLARDLIDNFNVKLSTANSINWGRLLPQVVYHASAYLDLVNQGVISIGEECDVCIPTGNFGNILAAFYAKEMGIPFKRIICASNENNILSEFFNSGVYDVKNRRLQPTSSPAIDILKSSNLERFLHLVTNGDGHLVKEAFESLHEDGVFSIGNELLKTISDDYNLFSDWCSEDECTRNINKVFKQTGYLLDPHTSVAKVVADRYRCDDRPMLICATAHPDKFPEDVLSAVGVEPERGNVLNMLRQLKDASDKPVTHRVLEASLTKPEIFSKVIEPSSEAVRSEIIAFCAE